MNGGSQHPDKRRQGGHGPTLADEVEHLVPGAAHYVETPAERPEAAGDELQLAVPFTAPSRGTCDTRVPAPGEAVWGRYAQTIARWERCLDRAAPAAIDDRGRLAAPFVEWMMGLAPGWVTAVPGLPRAAQFAALGNGVVPAQATGALRLLLDRARGGGGA
ncbi:DNA (cytosine-5-)-methyltransferase [Streptomyces sp. NBC_01433]|uniref:DNA (cytosine-5-)-methyltransferase n=1 Tax=Streptomyces sp. NBC_01433 TaxID=2903864 RepID=UPI002255F18B|nr:DNA (cytosine-5-)-methyltransferase [Streptomyces sp. NBC_01433]MCX4677660.1 DNA (cytosine-5-)-methyltransferase [Streptomyces sp. NBC_01433]